MIIAAANGSFKVSDVGRDRFRIEVHVTGLPPDSLIAPYPNPLDYDMNNTTINISFKLGSAVNEVFFTVYDLLGRTLYREELGMLSQGVNSLIYSPDIRLASGIYLYQITGDGVKISGKFTLLR